MKNSLLFKRLIVIFVKIVSNTINIKSKAMKLKTVLSALLLGVFGSFSAMQAQYMGPASWDAPLERSSFLAEQTKLTALDSLSVWQERVLLHTDKKAITGKGCVVL